MAEIHSVKVGHSSSPNLFGNRQSSNQAPSQHPLVQPGQQAQTHNTGVVNNTTQPGGIVPQDCLAN